MQGVSILIPAYNAAETITATLNSCLFDRKSLQEIIVVDDGSTDSTARLVETWSCEHDITLKLVRTRNKGGCAARNTAIASSTGDTLLWLDADDLLTPGKVAQIAQRPEPTPIIFLALLGLGFNPTNLSNKFKSPLTVGV